MAVTTLYKFDVEDARQALHMAGLALDVLEESSEAEMGQDEIVSELGSLVSAIEQLAEFVEEAKKGIAE